MGALSLTSLQAPSRSAASARFVPGVTPRPLPLRLSRLQRRPAGRRSLRPRLRPLYRRQSSSKPCCRLRRSPPSSSNPSRARAATSSPPPTSSSELRDICDRHGILLGRRRSPVRHAGRTGKWFAIQHAGVEPDIVCIRQGHRQSGMPPLRICMAKRPHHGLDPRLPRLHLRRQPHRHRRRPRHHGRPRALRYRQCRHTSAHKIMDRARTWMERIPHPLVGDVRGRGLMIGIELVARPRSPANPVSRSPQSHRSPLF